MKKISKLISIFLSAVTLVLFSFIAYGKAKLPDEASAYENRFLFMKIFSVKISDDNKTSTIKSFSSAELPLNKKNAVIKLFGAIPVKTININKNERRFVALGGELIGIRLKTNGVFIVGTESFDSENGLVCPAADAGIKAGDSLLSIDGKSVSNNEELSKCIENSNGKALSLSILREGKNLTLDIIPQKSVLTNRYKGGLWIRDSTGGVGTLTYYDFKTGAIASLGHGIYDVDTNALVPAESGSFLSAELTGVTKGESGVAGELKGYIGSDVMGEIRLNSENGIYGRLNHINISAKTYPVADIREVKTGHAQLIATVDNNKKSAYDIEIKKINNGSENKNMIISVTDEDLLDKTGGIVQGMSGSPIIQNGMFVGAVTHVFLNDPSKGYAIFSETMLATAQTIESEQINKAS